MLVSRKKFTYKTKFVVSTPPNLEEGVLYVMPHYGVTVHSCMCGCGEKVVIPILPISEGGWSWIYNSNGVTLNPSVGNYNQPCKSHYILTEGNVRWVTDSRRL